MTGHPFSPAGRRQALLGMSEGPLDLLIIGGGITGCGLARDAALRGLSVALVERDDFGAGTSSRSSKLIHGGLRYLEQFDLQMVREAARERQVLRHIAPHLVHPLAFIFPLWPGQSMAKYGLGLWLFDRLAGATPGERHRRLTAREVEDRLPGLRLPVKGGYLYHEYLTDDARLTLENALSAAQHGAFVANHAPARSLIIESGKVAGAMVADALTGESYAVRARVVVNATGPWAAETLREGGLTPPKALLPSKGVHLLFDAARLPVVGAAILSSPSGLRGFAIRRWHYVYVGTTDDAYAGSLDRVAADRGNVAELMRLVRDSFPGLELTESEIRGTWAGLRPLIAEPGRAARDTSRHDEVWRSPEGLLTIAGGKLTTYRPMARRVMEHVARELGRDLGSTSHLTAEVPLPGAPSGAGSDATAALTARGISPRAAERIAWVYGARAAELLRMGDADPAWLQPLAPGSDAVSGEIRLAVEQEMAATLTDALDRRSSLLLFSASHGLDEAEPAAQIMARLLGWSDVERRSQLAAYAEFAHLHSWRALH
jgi:glycerol-3-phosphate dehydrogenase